MRDGITGRGGGGEKGMVDRETEGGREDSYSCITERSSSETHRCIGASMRARARGLCIQDIKNIHIRR